ncbi:M14 family zinc carboxypeptidase [Granulicella arctica]|uniref:M14 family zinc carboxypeptidase n=1 Tax=Granulicella arctica TaxID=940613 RepID=UPI0021E01987|nr:M14 family zinc carboxypeptidase [Granulicella arctica]
MNLRNAASLMTVFALLSVNMSLAAQALNGDFARDPKQLADEEYAKHMQQYTTDPSFTSPLVDYLPASKTVPTPMKILGDVAGAPDMLPYAEDVYKYFRLLASSSPRVKVYTIGHTEEGREMIAAAIADENLLKNMSENKERLAKLADPRSIGMDDAKARTLVDASYPVYYITGTIHSPETGAPTALMELAYRLAVDDSPYIKYIRSHMIVLITPVVEVDGRDRMVDIYKWHKANPGKQWPRLTYWGHYVAHDNNRDAMGMTLNLTQNVLNTYLDFHAQVLHDLHESVPFLYDNTVGDGPYNAWIDPTLADEWAELGWNNVAQMQGLKMPGVFTHGDFDTWSPGYLMFLAGLHNGISRLYETFGNGGADTEKRILQPEEYSRTWYRQNPPLPVVTWSQRDNNNYEETALLTTLSYFSQHAHHFLENYYIKSKRAEQKPSTDGPAAYVFPVNESEANRQVQLLEVLKRQHLEISQLSSAVTTSIPAAKRGDKPTQEIIPAGSFVVRLDQPYSRVADALLDRQYWAPDDPQKHPYDDTGWSFSQLFNVKVLRVTDPAFLNATMTLATDLSTALGKLNGGGTVFAVANTGQSSLLALLYKLKNAHISVTQKAFDSEGQHFPAGSLLIEDALESAVTPILKELSLDGSRLSAKPTISTHPAAAPRIAFMHSWQATQTEGWWRYAFDKAGVPFDYISTQTITGMDDLRGKYDVIVFAPIGRASTHDIIDGSPMYGNALPWQKTELTPNLGLLDSTPDTRPGMGYSGLQHLRTFIEKGGLLITCEDTAEFAIDTGLAPGVSVVPRGDARVTGTVLDSIFVSVGSPVASGFGPTVPVMSANGLAFNISNTLGRANGRVLMDPYTQRPTGRGTVDDSDAPQGRKNNIDPEPLIKQQPWEAKVLNEDQMRNNLLVIPKEYRPEVILRFSDSKTMLLSGLLDKQASIAERAIVVNAHLGKGNVLLFANNPVYRGETVGTYPLVFNAIMNYDHLGDANKATK